MHIKQGYNEVEGIVNMNLDNMSKVLELYEPFKFLLSASRQALEQLEIGRFSWVFGWFEMVFPRNPAV